MVFQRADFDLHIIQIIPKHCPTCLQIWGVSVVEIFPEAQYALICVERLIELLLYLIWYLYTPMRFSSIVRPLRGFTAHMFFIKITMPSLKAKNCIPKASFCIPHSVKNEELYTRIVDFWGDWGHCRWKKYTNPRIWRKVYGFSYLGRGWRASQGCSSHLDMR